MIKRAAQLALQIKQFAHRLWIDERAELGSEGEPSGDEPPADEPPSGDPEGAASTPPDPAPAEPYLVVNDRTQYATREEAITGFQSATNRIQAYSRHGSPEEIEAKFSELDRIKTAANGVPKPDPKSGPDPYEGMSPEEKENWVAFRKRGTPILRDAGFVSNEDLDTEVGKRVAQHLAVDRQTREAMDNFQSLAKERGIPITPQGLTAMDHAARQIYDEDPLAKQLWDNNDAKGFTARVMTVIYGEYSSPPPNPDDPEPGQARNDKGQFIADAARYERTKQAAGTLPKAPPKASAAGTKGAEELSLKDRIDPAKRLQRAKQQFAEMDSAGV